MLNVTVPRCSGLRPPRSSSAPINAPPDRPALRHVACRAGLASSTETATANAVLAEDLLDRFRAADIDGNGYIDREEFGRLAESTGRGMEYAMFHWLEDHTVDELFAKYAKDSDEVTAITFESFRRLAEDGVLLEGRLTEYRNLFQRCESFQEDEGALFGTIAREDVEGLLSMLEHPLNSDEAHELMDGFCSDHACGNEEGSNRISFQEFLNLFRGHLLDLQQITEYLKLEDLPPPNMTDDEIREAEKFAGEISEPEKGVFKVESSEQFDSLTKLHPDKVVVLVAGLSWCRPCKSLGRPLQKFAEHYQDGAIFVKVLGDTNDNTKRFFKNKLKVKATPHLSFWRKGALAYSRTGANKTKLEDGVRRFYCKDSYTLPQGCLYPPKK
eukprot:jgi/Ulvmu1/12155/UM085_0019.1